MTFMDFIEKLVSLYKLNLTENCYTSLRILSLVMAAFAAGLLITVATMTQRRRVIVIIASIITPVSILLSTPLIEIVYKTAIFEPTFTLIKSGAITGENLLTFLQGNAMIIYQLFKMLIYSIVIILSWLFVFLSLIFFKKTKMKSVKILLRIALVILAFYNYFSTPFGPIFNILANLFFSEIEGNYGDVIQIIYTSIRYLFLMTPIVLLFVSAVLIKTKEKRIEKNFD